MTHLDALAEGTPVTVTLTQPGHTVQIHTRLGERFTALTLGNHHGTFSHLRDRGKSAARRWVTLRPLAADPASLYPTPLPPAGHDWRWWPHHLDVCLDAPEVVTIEPLTEQGQAWALAHETSGEKRARLIARFAEFDPASAEALDLLITELVDDAFQDGRFDAQESDQ